jgi:cell division protein ZapA (FtsZ GTPase activity inhibitor)
MSRITIDGREHEIDSLSDESKAVLTILKHVDAELPRLKAQTAALQTARVAYVRTLKQTLEKGKATEDDDIIQEMGDTIQFHE